MDPLVRLAMWLQQAIVVTNGTALAVAAAAALVSYGVASVPALWGLWALVTASFAVRLHQRQRPGVEHRSRLDVELGLHAAVLSYVAIECAPKGVAGPYQALVYAVLCATAVLGSKLTVAATGVLMVAIELALGLYVRRLPEASMWAHLIVLPVFGAMNWVIFRGEIARVRQASVDRVHSELSRIREAARSYRLGDAVRGPVGDEWHVSADPIDERLIQSSVEQLHVSLRLVLTLLRGTLGLRTAALLWRADQQLYLREVSSECERLSSGPFELDRGIVAAAFTTEQVVWIPASKSAGRIPLYSVEQTTGDVAVLPLFDGETPLGALVLDALPERTLDASCLQTLEEAARFAQRAVENERLFLTVQRTKDEQAKLYRATNLLAKARTEAEVIQAGVESARAFTRFDFAAVTLYHQASDSHEICAVSGQHADALVGKSFGANQGLVSMVVANRHPLPYRGEYYPGKHQVFAPDLEPPELGSLIVLPLYMHDAQLGALLLGSDEEGTFGDDVRPLLEVLAKHVSVSLANARMVKRLEDLATTDGLTGLLNKRALIEMAHLKIRSSQRFAKPLSVIVGDIDHFKKVNDTHGHDIGDVVIKGFGAILKRTKRETDAVGRFGGEEFVLVCEETDSTGARLLAERIRAELEATTFHTPQGTLQVTCSLGVATFPLAGHDWTALFKATDDALYVSKRKGRNRVSVWSAGLTEGTWKPPAVA